MVSRSRRFPVSSDKRFRKVPGAGDHGTPERWQQMIGYLREGVMACMGPPKKKGAEGTTEVWRYLLTDGQCDAAYGGYKYGSSFSSNINGGAASGDKSFCMVSVVMKDGVMRAVNYNGPSSKSVFASDEQSGMPSRTS